jgi:hypothetical protein
VGAIGRIVSGDDRTAVNDPAFRSAIVEFIQCVEARAEIVTIAIATPSPPLREVAHRAAVVPAARSEDDRGRGD